MSKTAGNGKFFELVAVAVACGKTLKAAAEACGCSERQAYRISGSPEFKQRVDELRTEATSQAIGALTSASLTAVETLKSLTSAEIEPKVRLDASKAILSALGPLSELGEIRTRIAKLERGE